MIPVHDPVQVFFSTVLLALLPFAVGLATPSLLRPGIDLGANPKGWLSGWPVAKDRSRGTLLALGLFAMIIPTVMLYDIARELLMLPWGGLVAFTAIPLGGAAARLVAVRPRTRWTWYAVLVSALVAAFVAAGFSSQFDDAAAAPPQRPRATDQHDQRMPGATESPQAPESPESSASPEETVQPGPYRPDVVGTPFGEYATDGICSVVYRVPVSVTVRGGAVVEATTEDGFAFSVADVREELVPCASVNDAQRPELRLGDGASIRLFDGGRYPEPGDDVQAGLPVAILGYLEDDDGGRWAWVARTVRDAGTTYSGLVPVGELQPM